MNRVMESGSKQLLNLTNKEGTSLTLCLRKYIPGDESGIIACIRDEYGSTYFKRNLYLPEQIRKESDSGHITFLVAETLSGEIAGMLILKDFAPEESMCEVASNICKKQYRGYGLAMPFFEYGMEILKSRHYSAAYCLPVLFHDITQRLLYRLGLRATGFVLNVFNMERITHSYHHGRNKKHSQGIQIMALGKKDAGTLYLPTEHVEFCKKVYNSLGVAYRIREENQRKLPVRSMIQARQDMLQSSLEIRIHKVGKDLPEQIEKLHAQYPLRGMQTANVFLNMNDSNAVWAYRRLTDMRYFFTGLKPLCSQREYMVLHNAGEVEMYLEDYVLTREFKELAEYVEKKKQGRNERGIKSKNEKKEKTIHSLQGHNPAP